MPPLHISEVYAQELLQKQHGYALWYPEPEVGPPPRDVQIGDVGFFYQGKFKPLFNITVAEDNPANSLGVPVGFVPIQGRLEPLLQHEPNALQTKVISSSSVHHTEVKAGITGNSPIAGGGAGYEYHFAERSGAILLIKDDAALDCMVPNNLFPMYMKEHYGAWEEWATEMGFAVRSTPLVLVRGTIKTPSEWTMAAFRSRNERTSVSLQGTFVSIAEGGFKLTKEVEMNGSVEYRSGPLSRMPLPIAGPSISPNITQDASLVMNQCLFLQVYKIRFRAGLARILPPGMAIKAAAEYDELPRPEDPDEDTAMVVETENEDNTLMGHIAAEMASDCVDVVLEYILDVSEADAAIACENDIHALFTTTEWPNDLRQWLYEHRPAIEVKNSLGTLSLLEAIMNERIRKLRALNDTRRGVAALECIDINGEGELVREDSMDEGTATRWPHMILSDKVSSPLVCMTVSHDGRLIATGSENCVVHVWNAQTGHLQQKLKGHISPVECMTFTADSCHLISGSAKTGEIILWESCSEARYLGRHEGDVLSLAVSPSSRWLASGSAGCEIVVWDLDQAASPCVRIRIMYTAPIHRIIFSPDGSKVVSCAQYAILIHNIADGRLVTEVSASHSIGASTSGTMFATSNGDLANLVWEEGIPNVDVTSLQNPTVPISTACFSPYGEEIATAAADSDILVTYSTSDGSRRHVFSGHASPISSVAYSDNGSWIACGVSSGEVRLWERASARCIAEFRGHRGRVSFLAFIEGNVNLVSSSVDGSVRIWNVQDVLRLDDNVSEYDGAKKSRAVRNSLSMHPTPLRREDSYSTISQMSPLFETASMFSQAWTSDSSTPPSPAVSQGASSPGRIRGDGSISAETHVQENTRRFNSSDSDFHTFLSLELAPTHGIVVPQRVYRSQGSSLQPHSSVSFPGPLYLNDALAERYRGQPIYERRPETTASDKASLTLRILWPGYQPWECSITVRERTQEALPVPRWLLARRIAEAIQRFQREAVVQDNATDWGFNNIDYKRLILHQLRQVNHGNWQAVILYDAGNLGREDAL